MSDERVDKVIDVIIPEKIKKFEELLKLDRFQWSMRDKLETATRNSIKDFVEDPLTNNAQKNPEVWETFELLRGELEEMIDICCDIRRWLMVRLPKADDATGIDTEVKAEALELCSTYLDQYKDDIGDISGYSNVRAEKLQKVKKHPTILDWVENIVAFDWTQYTDLIVCCRRLHLSYIYLQSYFEKNSEFIRKLRMSTSAASMYD